MNYVYFIIDYIMYYNEFELGSLKNKMIYNMFTLYL